MGRSHALSGWCVGLALAPLAGLSSMTQVVPFAMVTAGFALLPDLDHPGATASKLFGPVTGLLSRLLRALSAILYRATKGPADEDCTGTHRHATHTFAFALLTGGGTAIGTTVGGPWVVAGTVLFALLLAEAVLGDWVLLATGGALLFTLTQGGGAIAVLEGMSGWIGVAVGAGCVTHCLGDALTESGCPFLWPIPIAGETWYELRPPGLLRFHTGKWFEQAVVFPAFAVLGVALLPGVWTTAMGVVQP